MRIRMKSFPVAIMLLICVFLSSGIIFATVRSNNGLKITVEDADVTAGSTVNVDIVVENNPGFMGAILNIEYDDGLTLIGATQGSAFSSLTMTSPGSFSSPCNFVWDSIEINDTEINDGVILTLTFDVDEDATSGDSYNVTVSDANSELIDTEFNPISASFQSGTVTVKASELDENAPVFSVDNVQAAQGSTVNVSVSVNNNPGILGALLTITYDDGLVLKDAESAEAFSSLTMTKPGVFTSPCNFIWDATEPDENATDGSVLNLSFEVPSNAAEGTVYNISVSGNSENIIDNSLNPLNASYISGTITVVPNGEHQYVLIDAIEPDCENAGIYIYECSDCGDTYIEEPEALGHNVVIDAAVEPTCTENGLTEGSRCSRCGKIFTAQETIAPLGHSIVIDPAVAATCTENGFTEGSHCERCNAVIVPRETIPATGHQFEFYRSTVTCTRDGYVIYKCSVCGKLSNVKTSGYGHDYHFNRYESDNDKLVYICSDCNNVERLTPEEALEIWMPDHINTIPVRANENQFLDVNNDGFINGKDYAKIYHYKNYGR